VTTTDLLIDAVSQWTPARFDTSPGSASSRPRMSAKPIAARGVHPLIAAGYQVRLAANAAEVSATQQLRREIFADCGTGTDDPRGNAWASQRIEQYFDDRSDHLIIWHQGPTGEPEVAAAARLLPPHANDASPRGAGLAADQHFGVRPLERLLNSTVEVGRVCVHPDHRAGSAAALLVAGIARYQHLTGYRYLLGCVSLDVRDGGRSAAAVWDLALAGHLAPAHRRCRPRDPIAIGGLARAEYPVIPPLLRSCLRLGAQVCGPPGFNEAAGTADFLLLLDQQDPVRRLSRR
jgi:putative hemolysin